MDVGGQCLLISFQPENHFRILERIGPVRFHDIILATEIYSQFDIKTLGVAIHTIRIYCTIWKLSTRVKDRKMFLYT